MKYFVEHQEPLIIKNILRNNPNLKLGFSMLQPAEYVTHDGQYATQMVAYELDPTKLDVKLIEVQSITVNLPMDEQEVVLENVGDAKYLHPYMGYLNYNIDLQVGDTVEKTDPNTLVRKTVVVTEEMWKSYQTFTFRFALS
jgi:hypothetical protein